VEAKRSSGGTLKALFEVHFANPQEKRLIALGLIKLELARLWPARYDSTFLGNYSDPNNITEAKKWLVAYVGGASVESAFDDDSRKLLVTLTCSTYLDTGIPATTSNPFDFAPGKDCVDFSLNNAVPGLKRLKDYVEKLPG
jgi:hypothetical protein